MNLNHNMPVNVWTIVIRLSNSIYSFLNVQFNLFHIYLFYISTCPSINSIFVHSYAYFFFCSCKFKLSTRHHHFFLTHQLKNVAKKKNIWKSYFYRTIIGQRHKICFIFIMACVYVHCFHWHIYGETRLFLRWQLICLILDVI